MALRELLTVPDGVCHAADVLAALDRCFVVGFGRLGPEQNEALQAFGRVCAGTPLEAPVAAALDAIGRHEFIDRHFAALAAARAALQGAQHDALQTQALAALGRTPAEEPPADGDGAREDAGPVAVWQESTRNWLMELALTGFRQLEPQTLAPFAATLEQLQGEPRVMRLAALLTGLLRELLAAMPVAALPELPVFRWADLWTRAMLGSLRPPASPSGRAVSGTLSVLGVDLHHHGHFVSFDAYALLEADGATRVVRTTHSAYKVDVIQGMEMWQCFSTKLDPLLRAVSEHVVLKVEGMTLLPTGDLLWDGKAAVGKPFALPETAARWLAPGASPAPASPVAAPADRHPVQIAEPVWLEGYTMQGGEAPHLDLGDGAHLPVAIERLSGASELTATEVVGSKALLGLLRFDAGRWEVQPLAVVGGGKKGGLSFTGSGVYAFLHSGKGATLATLQERASRLLRQKT